MAWIGNSCIYIGDENWFIGNELSSQPVAVLANSDFFNVVNTPITIDGSLSYSDDENDTLYFEWSFSQTPINSSVRDRDLVIVGEGLVRFSPDVVGDYIIQLVVRAANGGCSEPVEAVVHCSALLKAWNEKLELDSSWIWELLPDFWSVVPSLDRTKVESFWNGISQIMGSDFLTLYNTDFNKSISSIQDKILLRWYGIDPKLALTSRNTIIVNSASEVSMDILSANKAELSVNPFRDNSFNSFGIMPNNYKIRVNSKVLSSDVGRSVTIVFDNTEHIRSIIGVSYEDNEWSLNSPIYTITKPTEVSIFLHKTSKNLYGISGGLVENLIDLHNNTAYFANSISGQTLQVNCTLIAEYDIEKEGVSPGDLLVSEITNLEGNIKLTVSSKILACRKNVVVFAPSIEDGWITEDNSNEVVALFGVKKPLITAIFNSGKFRSRYFNTEISSSDPIYFGEASFRVIPKYIVRNTMIPIDDNILQFLSVSEFIGIPEIHDRVLYGKDEVRVSIDRDPVNLTPNIDYVITSVEYYGGGLHGLAGSNSIHSEDCNFELHHVLPGDTLKILTGFSKGSYLISTVDGKQLTLETPVPNLLFEDDFLIIRKLEKNYLRFNSVFSPESPCPPYLWAETSILSNDTAIENNFGKAVKLTREEYRAWGLPNTYKAIITSLMNTKISGPFFDSVRRAVSTIEGIPIIEVAGIIREITLSYIHDQQGNPKKDRILVEDLDDFGEPTGFYRVFYCKAQNALSLEEFSGININPRTAQPFNEGDLVYAGDILGKGVIIEDKYTSASFPVVGLLAYHTFRIVSDVDAIIQNREAIGYLYSFLREIRPHYVWMLFVLLKYLVDTIEIEESVLFKYRLRLFDDAYHLLIGASIFDEYLQSFQMFDSPNRMLRSIWRTDDLVIVDTDTVRSPTGGFITPPEYTYFDGDVVRPGDYLLIKNKRYRGLYPITAVLSDTDLSVDNGGHMVDFNEVYSFEVIRDTLGIHPVLATVDEGINSHIGIDDGIQSSDISIGDLVSFTEEGAETYRIIRSVDIQNNRYEVVPELTLPAGDYPVNIIRTWYRPKILLTTEIQEAINGKITLNSPVTRYGIFPGDVVIYRNREYPIVATSLDGVLYTYPKIPDGENIDIVIESRVNTDELDAMDKTIRKIEDVLLLKLRWITCLPEGDYLTVLPNPTTYNLRPGDIIKTDINVDLGEGPGVFRVVDVGSDGVYTSYTFPSFDPIQVEIWKHTPAWIREIE